MKIKSLLLGSLAIAGMSGLATGAYAADLAKGVMTSLDVCDALGLSGLTISSDTDCLQISGGVSYSFTWGDYKAGTGTAAGGLAILQDETSNPYRIPQPGNATAYGTGLPGVSTDWDSQMTAWLQAVGTADSDFGPAKVVIHMESEQYRHSANGYGWYDGGDTGGATTNVGTGEYNAGGVPHASAVGQSGAVVFDQAYVSVGDSTVLTAGKTGSVANIGDDTPLNYLGLFNSDGVGTGVLWSVNQIGGGKTYNGTDTNGGADIQLGGESVQLTSSLGNGVTLKGGLEDINDTNNARAGTAVGVISYAGDDITAHLTLIEGGVLDGNPKMFAYHAGFTGTFDKFSIVGAGAGDQTGYFDGLVSAQASLDMFKLAASGEFMHYGTTATTDPVTLGGGLFPGGANAGTGGSIPVAFGTPGSVSHYGADGAYLGTYVSSAGKSAFGAGLSATMAISDGVSLNLGGRYFDSDTSTTGNEAYQIAASLVAAVTETITLTGEVGVFGTDAFLPVQTGGGTNGPSVLQHLGANGTTNVTPTSVGSPVTEGSWYDVGYGAASVAWAPGGGFTSSLRAAAYSNGAYQGTFTAAKTFQ
jgi:hypothetical protein